MIYLQHTSNGSDNTLFLKILNDGSNKSKWIYLRINTGIDDLDKSAHFYLDNSLLLNTKFVLNVEWCSEDNIDIKDIIDGTKLTKKELKKNAINYAKENKFFSSIMSNEILVKNNIDLHKYLVSFNKYVAKKDENILNYLKDYYPNVKLI
jgi:hypothetical protein